MGEGSNDATMRRAALVAGISLVFMTAAAVFATDLSIGRLTVAGDAVATAANIRDSESLYRAGIFGWVVVLLCDVLAAWGLYVYFEPAGRRLSLLAAWVRLVYAAMLGAAIFYLVDVLLLIGEGGSAAYGAGRLPAIVMMRIEGFSDVWAVSLILFGVHILLIGRLAWKSGYVPKIFGALMIISFFGYVLNNTADLLTPGLGAVKSVFEWIFILPMVAGEVGLGIWLLVRGFKVRLEPEIDI